MLFLKKKKKKSVPTNYDLVKLWDLGKLLCFVDHSINEFLKKNTNKLTYKTKFERIHLKSLKS